MDNRRAFFRKFFPKWSGFHVYCFDDTIQPDEALQKLQRLVEDISDVHISDSDYPSCWTVDSNELNLREVCVASQYKYIENGKILEMKLKTVRKKLWMCNQD